MQLVNEGNIASLIKSCSFTERGKLIENVFEKLLHSAVTSSNIVEIARATVSTEPDPASSDIVGRKAFIKCLGRLLPSDAQKIMKFGNHGCNPGDIARVIGVKDSCKLPAWGSYESETLVDRLCKLLLPKSMSGYGNDVVVQEVAVEGVANAIITEPSVICVVTPRLGMMRMLKLQGPRLSHEHISKFY